MFSPAPLPFPFFLFCISRSSKKGFCFHVPCFYFYFLLPYAQLSPHCLVSCSPCLMTKLPSVQDFPRGQSLFLACVPADTFPEDLTRKVINNAVRSQEVISNLDDLYQLNSGWLQMVNMQLTLDVVPDPCGARWEPKQSPSLLSSVWVSVSAGASSLHLCLPFYITDS